MQVEQTDAILSSPPVAALGEWLRKQGQSESLVYWQSWVLHSGGAEEPAEDSSSDSGGQQQRRRTLRATSQRGGKEAALQQRCSAVWHLSEEDGRVWRDDARPAATGVWLPPTRPADHPLKARRTLGARSKEGGAAAWTGVNTVTDM
ncbi:unnamed protein product [Closterium sp. NIES-64]|nr:unnamed protein product [Closterium sp. NIES-64]